MSDIIIDNISDLNLDGSDLFQDSESFIIELDDDGESIFGGSRRGIGSGSGNGSGSGMGIFNCGNTICYNTIGMCGYTAGCNVTIV